MKVKVAKSTERTKNSYKGKLVGVHGVVISLGLNVVLVACGRMHDALDVSWYGLKVGWRLVDKFKCQKDSTSNFFPFYPQYNDHSRMNDPKGKIL